MNISEITDKTGVVILSAGKGTRLNCGDMPKVMLPIGGKPMVSYIVKTLKEIGFQNNQICLVIGYKKEKVIEYFGSEVIYATQEEQLGTAHAAYVGMKNLDDSIKEVLVLNGDDSAFYSVSTVENLITKHLQNDVMASLLSTVIPNSSFAYGRVVRQENGEIEIVEKEYLTEEHAKINETSTGTFCFNRQWYNGVFPNMPKLEKLGEYGLPTAFTMAQREGLSVQVINLLNPREWFGVNSKEELQEADDRKQIGKF